MKIDSEFSALIPPLSTDEYAALEASLLAEGCRDALVTWNGLLIDGHNRYAICEKHAIAYQVVSREFESREDVVIWMVQNQLARRNLTTFARSELALKSKAAIEAKAKANLITSTGGDNPRPLLKSTKAEKINTRKELAEIADTGQDTIYKVEIITESAPEPVKASARQGDLSINRAYKITRALEKSPDEYKERIIALCGDNDEKIHILNRLYKTQGSPETNGTFEEIITNGGFHSGKEMNEWIDFAGGSVQSIQKALGVLAEHHKQMAKEVKRQEKQMLQDRTSLEEENDYRILTGDLSLLFDAIPDESIDLFFTDPPYHADKPMLYGELSLLASRKLKPGGICLAYSGQMHLPQVLSEMNQHLAYWWIFAIRHTGGHLTIWNRQIWNDWKPVLAFAKTYSNGKLPTALDWTQDFVEGGGRNKAFHKWGQDANEATYWIERLTAPGALVCDPFVGGGAIGVACKLTKRRYIGTELDDNQAIIARNRLQEIQHDATHSL